MFRARHLRLAAAGVSGAAGSGIPGSAGESPADAQAYASELEREIYEMETKPADKSAKPKKSREPLIARWWVPYVCGAALVGIWIPDKYKVRALYYIDEGHDNIKLQVHKWYWRATMPADKYALLMEQLEANVPKGQRVESTDCPL